MNIIRKMVKAKNLMVAKTTTKSYIIMDKMSTKIRPTNTLRYEPMSEFHSHTVASVSLET